MVVLVVVFCFILFCGALLFLSVGSRISLRGGRKDAFRPRCNLLLRRVTSDFNGVKNDVFVLLLILLLASSVYTVVVYCVHAPLNKKARSISVHVCVEFGSRRVSQY